MEDVGKALRALGISRVVMHAHRFPLEFCADCGAPMFPNAAGHAVRAEPPEDLGSSGHPVALTPRARPRR